MYNSMHRLKSNHKLVRSNQKRIQITMFLLSGSLEHGFVPPPELQPDASLN